MSRLAVLAAVAFLLAGCRAPAPQSTDVHAAPTSQPAAAAVRVTLEPGVALYAPPCLGRARPECDLLIHFHGAPEVVEREANLARLCCVIVTVNIRGLSAAYEAPYSAPQRFTALVDKALEAARAQAILTPTGKWRRVCLSSFSAGYGAIRAILRQDEDRARLAGVYLADSLYAGWGPEGPYKGIDVANVAPFRVLAKEAAAGGPVFIVSHSYLDPEKYAGTHETAADLIACVGATSRTVSEPGPADMRIDRRADLGNFHLWGCRTPTNEHVRHLQNMHYWLAHLPLDHAE